MKHHHRIHYHCMRHLPVNTLWPHIFLNPIHCVHGHNVGHNLVWVQKTTILYYQLSSLLTSMPHLFLTSLISTFKLKSKNLVAKHINPHVGWDTCSCVGSFRIRKCLLFIFVILFIGSNSWINIMLAYFQSTLLRISICFIYKVVQMCSLFIIIVYLHG